MSQFLPKSSVSALQELCAQNKATSPNYIVIPSDESGFICKVEVMGLEEYGSGRSKRDAKHLAATNALKRLRQTSEIPINLNAIEIDDYEDFVDSEPLPPVDTVELLRNYCVQNDHPLPKFELVSQFGTPNAPRFTMLCQIASIKRYRTSDSKKDAKQKAAFQMFLVIKDLQSSAENEMELISMKAKMESVEEERVRLFKSYRQLVDSGENPEDFGTPLFERHNALNKFHDNLKQAALNILNDQSYESSKAKVYEALNALKLNAKLDKVPSTKGGEMIFIQLDCPGLDVCFSGFEDELYDEIIDYFKNMLI